jgi:hypothetical protein
MQFFANVDSIRSPKLTPEPDQVFERGLPAVSGNRQGREATGFAITRIVDIDEVHMPSSDKPKVETEAQEAERFKAVVKRLLDTPPMHKPAKGKRPMKPATRAK